VHVRGLDTAPANRDIRVKIALRAESVQRGSPMLGANGIVGVTTVAKRVDRVVDDASTLPTFLPEWP
jgi:hypothetical protein